MIAIAHLATSRGAIALYMLVIAGLEKKFQFIKPAVKWAENHKGIVAAAAAEAEKAVSNALHSPKLAGVELEAAHLKNQVEQSLVFKAATAVLHNVTVKVEDMTPEMKNSVAVAITNEVHSLFGKTVSVNQVLGVVDEFQSLAAKVSSSPSVTAVDQLTQAAVQSASASAVNVKDSTKKKAATTEPAPTPTA